MQDSAQLSYWMTVSAGQRTEVCAVQCTVVCESRKIGSVNVTLTDGSESVSTHNRHIYCPILVQFCTTDVHLPVERPSVPGRPACSYDRQ